MGVGFKGTGGDNEQISTICDQRLQIADLRRKKKSSFVPLGVFGGQNPKSFSTEHLKIYPREQKYSVFQNRQSLISDRRSS
jgi:hypothetical protein